MQNEYIVRDLYVSDGNRTIKASYFVDSGSIHARVNGRNLTLPVGDDDSEEGLRTSSSGKLTCGTGAKALLLVGFLGGIGRGSRTTG